MTLYQTRVPIALLLALALLGCATPRLDHAGSRDDLYTQARYALEISDFPRAISIYEALLAGGHGDDISEAAQLEIGHAALRAGQPGRAMAEADNFIARFAGSEQAGHAYVLAAVAAFENATNIRQTTGRGPAYERAYHAAMSRLQMALANYPDYSPGTILSQMSLELRQYPP